MDPFQQIEDELEGFLKAIAPAELEKSKHLNGKTSATPIIKQNIISDPAEVRKTLDTAFRFSEFQELNLYHESGFFETNVNFELDSMPLLPKMMSPLFGKSIGEMLFGTYVQETFPIPRQPTFLGLGAGKGYLDLDLIKHLTAKGFDHPEYPAFAAAIRDRSSFIVSDRTSRSMGMLEDRLRPLSAMNGRVQVRNLNAMDFALEPRPEFGIIYANELLDNMPTEPIIQYQGNLYIVKIAARISGAPITKTEASEKIRAKNSGQLEFVPLFIPAEQDTDLSMTHEVRRLVEYQITRPEFNGIYPLSTGLDSMFASARRSFNTGIFMLIDYVSHGEAMHNYNKAVNAFSKFRFGEDDLDFQIDPRLVQLSANNNRMRTLTSQPLSEVFQMTMPLVQTFTADDWKSAFDSIGVPCCTENMPRLLFSYKFLAEFSQKYQLMTFRF